MATMTTQDKPIPVTPIRYDASLGHVTQEAASDGTAPVRIDRPSLDAIRTLIRQEVHAALHPEPPDPCRGLTCHPVRCSLCQREPDMPVQCHTCDALLCVACWRKHHRKVEGENALYPLEQDRRR